MLTTLENVCLGVFGFLIVLGCLVSLGCFVCLGCFIGSLFVGVCLVCFCSFYRIRILESGRLFTQNKGFIGICLLVSLVVPGSALSNISLSKPGECLYVNLRKQQTFVGIENGVNKSLRIFVQGSWLYSGTFLRMKLHCFRDEPF